MDKQWIMTIGLHSITWTPTNQPWIIYGLGFAQKVLRVELNSCRFFVQNWFVSKERWMNTLIKVISFTFYYFFPSLRQQGNPTTRCLSAIHSSIHFWTSSKSGEVCVRKCVASIGRDSNPTVSSLESMLNAGGFPI